MKKFEIKEGLFNTLTLFVIGDYAEANNYLKKLGVKTSLNELWVGAVLNTEKSLFRVVWLENLKDIPTIIHELFHLVVRICHDKGIPIRDRIETGECGDETAAYLLEFYVREVLELKRKNRK